LSLSLDQLDKAKRRFGQPRQLLSLLHRLARQQFKDPAALIRFHETLLFLRAYPQSTEIARRCNLLLKGIPERIKSLERSGIDTSQFVNPEVSGIAGTFVTDCFSFNIVRWLSERYPSQLVLDWEWFEDEERLASIWPRFMPLLEEEAQVEANVPYLDWLRAARNGKQELPWIIEQFEHLMLSEAEKAELYDSLKLYVRWTPSFRASRTGMRLKVRKLFTHQDKLIPRSAVDLDKELRTVAPTSTKLSAGQGRRILDLARETSTLRYRELFGFTHGDEKRVLKASLGRGVDLFVMGVPPGDRLPLRAYHAAMIFKNGIPIGYFEGLSLFDRMESGFNLYYTFREGETAWIYARTLKVFRQLLGITAFVLDPYQIGYKNEEGIESGAFWFYRKLGFRPTSQKIRKLTEREEAKIARRDSYRTPPGILRQLATSPLIFELDENRSGDWDRFSVRAIGLSVQRRMAAKHQGSAIRIREESVKLISQMLAIKRADLEKFSSALSDFAVVLALVPDLRDWSKQEKEAVVRIIQAKANADEARYLRLMQRHSKLRSAFIKLGS